ncbi:hypothetical protein QLL95_gp0766 [Cotonvirus japonicus]|uniref:Uncharacterized protein n=1 Tax=Cotonvirus japonicus TaxID=2811091 RepID=A0ABM7NTF9_9VIRU|nr:hypothetical protein QLL95_gp0766 [Cotonvirus japonicus]BCS83357.1 hypothetical protein [Cotonvirus japonicus]
MFRFNLASRSKFIKNLANKNIFGIIVELAFDDIICNDDITSDIDNTNNLIIPKFDIDIPITHKLTIEI